MGTRSQPFPGPHLDCCPPLSSNARLQVIHPVGVTLGGIHKSSFSSMGISSIQDREFDATIEAASVPILIEFWQPGCGHCQALLKELELIQEKLGPRLLIFKMNVQENFLIPGELEIQALPTLALYHQGQFQQFIGGIGKKEHLLQTLQPWVSSKD